MLFLVFNFCASFAEISLPPRSAAVLSDTIIINDEADNHKHNWKKQGERGRLRL